MKRSPWHLLRHALAKPGLVFVAMLIALLLASPSIRGGLSSDDHIQRMFVQGHGRCLDLFTFAHGDEASMRLQKSAGTMPWYADDGLKISFFRPLASLSHCIDYRYLDAFPGLLHLENLLWMSAAIGSAFLLFRRTASAPWIAGLATLLFAIDDAHGPTVGWIANRNTLMATTFGILAVGLHHRARIEGSRPSRWLAPPAFLLALLSAEAAVAAIAYLVAHAIFLDRARPLSRMRALLPYVAIIAVWRMAYAGLGFGQYGSALYTDPIASPERFLAALGERAPILLLSQLGGPSADIYSILPSGERRTAWIIALASLSIVALVLAPLLRRRAEARFFALGMVLAALPACATVPGDRLLMLVGVGGMGLVGEGLGALLDSDLPKSWAFRAPSYLLGAIWTLVHVIAAPVLLPGRSLAIADTGEWIEKASESLFADTEPETGVIVLHAENMYACTFATFLSYSLGHARGGGAQCLSGGEGAVEILRVGSKRLVVRPEGGFVDEAREPFWNADKPMRVEDKFDLDWLTITVTAASNEGEPLEAMFEFARSLDDSKLTLRYWNAREGKYLPAPLPPLWGRYRIENGEIVNIERRE